MKILINKILPILALSALANSVYANDIVEYCDFESHEGEKIQISPMAASNKSLSRKRFNHPKVYTHFSYEYNNKSPVFQKTIVHRSAIINGNEFYRVNEGTQTHPKFVRYYDTTLEDCTKIHFRVEEESEEFKEYWRERAGRVLSFHEFIEDQSEIFSFIPENSIGKLKKVVGKKITLIPMRTDKWYFKSKDGDPYLYIPSPKEIFTISEIRKKPFMHMGNMISPLSIKLRDENGSMYWAPGHSHGIHLWSKHKGESLVVGGSEDSVIAHYGEPDRVVYLPIFKSPSGGVVIEDDIIKERIKIGSGYLIPKIKRSEKIGNLKRFEYDVGDGIKAILFDKDGKIREIQDEKR